MIKNVRQSLDFIENHAHLPIEQQNVWSQFLPTMEKNLLDACNRKAPFSATAIAFVRQKQHEPWLAHLIPGLDLSD